MDCEIEHRATVELDFILEDDKDELLTTLRTLYDDTQNIIAQAVSPRGVESGQSYLFTNPDFEGADSFHIENSEHFDSIYSHVTDVEKTVLGMSTVGMISDDERELIQQMERDDGRNRVRIHSENFKKFRESVPTISDLTFHCSISYLELQRPELESQEANSTDTLHGLWDDCSDELNKYHIYFADSVSSLEVEGNVYLLSPQVMSRPFGSLSLVNLTPDENNEDTDSDGLPEWYEVIRTIYPYLKLGEVLSFRLNQLNQIERNLHDVIGSVQEMSDKNADELLTIQDELSGIRSEWVEANVQIVNELEELRSEHSEILEGSSELEFESSPPAPEDTMGSSTALTPIWAANIQEWMDEIESFRTRVSKKHDESSSFLHNTIMAQSAITNIGLQDKISFLTKVLLGLTSALLLLTLILLIVDILIFMQ